MLLLCGFEKMNSLICVLWNAVIVGSKRKAYEEINNSPFKALKNWLYWIKQEAADWRLRRKQSTEQLFMKWGPLSCICNEAALTEKIVQDRALEDCNMMHSPEAILFPQAALFDIS